MVPWVPAGTTQPCCQPFTATGTSRVPSGARATQPPLLLSGTTSTRETAAPDTVTSRRAGPQAPTSAGVTAAVSAASDGPDSVALSTTNAEPGLISSSC